MLKRQSQQNCGSAARHLFKVKNVYFIKYMTVGYKLWCLTLLFSNLLKKRSDHQLDLLLCLLKRHLPNIPTLRQYINRRRYISSGFSTIIIGLKNGFLVSRPLTWILELWFINNKLMSTIFLQSCCRYPFSTLYSGGIWSSISSVSKSLFQQPTWISVSTKESKVSSRQPRFIWWNSEKLILVG